MSIQAHNIDRLALDLGMKAWSDRWALVNGVLICARCGQRQRPSEATATFVHGEACPLLHAHVEHPWKELAELLRPLPPEAAA